MPKFEGAADLYPAHLKELQTGMAENLHEHELDAVVFASGRPVHHHRDDMGAAFRGNADFVRAVGGLSATRDNQFANNGADLSYTPGNFVAFDQSSERPTLFVTRDSKEFWYMQPGIPEQARALFNLREGTADEVKMALREYKSKKRVAGVGRKTDFAGFGGLQNDPAAFLNAMDRNSVVKTPFEIAAMLEANVHTARAHEAAKEAFYGGATEGAILDAFSRGGKQMIPRQSFPPIAAMGNHASFLHYEGGDYDFGGGEDLLLLDAGITNLGYPADVTSTFLKHNAHPVLREVVHGLDTIQRELVKMLTVDSNFGEMQREMHIKIGELLLKVGILKNCSAQEAAEAGFTKVFCPHSIGHSLGVRTHDRGMLELGEGGKPIMMTAENQSDPILRGTALRRPFVENQVMTVEPGIYFIKGLLDQKRSDTDHFDWSLIDQLEGGARIETDVWVTRQALEGNVDLTRLSLPRGTNV
jgi:Xaa-Pro dipeptidase